MAFQPLEPEGGATSEQTPTVRGATDDDDTAVIPPASQAANRRAKQ